MQLRKNTKAFKTILDIVTRCRDRPDRENLIRLYITKAGDSVRERISVEAMDDQAGVFYEMNYDAVLTKLQSPNHQLQSSDDVPGIYFFHSTSNKAWDETPFEFDEVISKEFGVLPDLPIVRKKEKVDKFVFPAKKTTGDRKPDTTLKDTAKPTPDTRDESKPVSKSKSASKVKEAKLSAKDSSEQNAPSGEVPRAPKQPDYHLRHKIAFTKLDRIVFRQAQLNKKHVLDYYDKVAGHILPYLKDRPVAIQLQQTTGRTVDVAGLDALAKNNIEIPEWLERPPGTKGKPAPDVLLCNDKEHLLFYVEAGSLSFNVTSSRIKSIGLPDYIIIGIESPDAAIAKAAHAAVAVKEILSGLKLPSFIKADGLSALHVYVPLETNSDFETARAIGEYICKLVRLKLPDLVLFKGMENYNYGKVSLDYQINEEWKFSIAPYSLVSGEAPTVATPLLWEEINKDVRAEGFNHETILKRLSQTGDPFESLFKKRVNANETLLRLHQNYSFLF